MVVHLESPDKRYDMLYLANLAILQVKDELGRLPGVGNVQVFARAISACASGSIQPIGLAQFDRYGRWCKRFANRMCRSLRVCLVLRRQTPEAPRFNCWLTRRDGSDRGRIQQHHCARRQGWPDHAHPRCGPRGIGFEHLCASQLAGQQTCRSSSHLAAARLERTANFATSARHD